MDSFDTALADLAHQWWESRREAPTRASDLLELPTAAGLARANAAPRRRATHALPPVAVDPEQRCVQVPAQPMPMEPESSPAAPVAEEPRPRSRFEQALDLVMGVKRG